VFVVAGAALLALTYGLLASRLPADAAVSKAPSARNAKLLAACKQTPVTITTKSGQIVNSPKQSGPAPSPALLEECKKAFALGARSAASSQRSRALSTLLSASLIGLALITMLSGLLGWFLAGRVLQPIRRMTESARRASELDLSARLALEGPDDELKELADTFDDMLERLEAAFESQQRFVANAAHELRTPLTVMRTSIEVTLSKPTRTEEQLEAMVAKIRRSLARAEATVDALLTLASTQQLDHAEEPVDLATAAEDAVDAISSLTTERGIAVEAVLDPAPVLGDPVLLERMVANLVENAAKHNEPRGWIQVRTLSDERGGVLKIANTGPVVPQDQIPELLEPFGRAEHRLSSSDGMGLGLSIATAIARAHGTEVVVSSRNGGGLEIEVALPRPAPAPLAA
jgi:signal transduction histidine kinase